MSGFALFSSLPPEIRHKIWLENLDDVRTPRTYRFDLIVPKQDYHERLERRMSALTPPPPTATTSTTRTGFVAPPFLGVPGLGPDFSIEKPGPSLSALIEKTFQTRAISATCAESRHVVLRHWPHTLEFCPKRTWQFYPKFGKLRFNNARDIVMLLSKWADLRDFWEALKQFGIDVLGPFRCIERLGLESRYLGIHRHRPLEPAYRRWWLRSCRCEDEDCADRCVNDPLPKFVQSFPFLRELIIFSRPDRVNAYFVSPSIPHCQCPPDPSSGHPPHPWETVLGDPVDIWDRYIIYDERAGCIPPLDEVQKARGYYRANYPYFQELEHLKILSARVLQNSE